MHHLPNKRPHNIWKSDITVFEINVYMEAIIFCFGVLHEVLMPSYLKFAYFNIQ